MVKTFPHVDPSCPHCKAQPADLIHMFWSCSNLKSFWTSIFNAYSQMLQVNLPPDPLCDLFGYSQKIHHCPKKAHILIAFTSLIARRLILLLWKSQTPPTFNRWIKDIMHFLKLEKINFTLKGSLQDFRTVWTPFLKYYDSLKTSLEKDD